DPTSPARHYRTGVSVRFRIRSVSRCDPFSILFPMLERSRVTIPGGHGLPLVFLHRREHLTLAELVHQIADLFGVLNVTIGRLRTEEVAALVLADVELVAEGSNYLCSSCDAGR